MTSERQSALVREKESRLIPVVFALLAFIIFFNVQLLWITKDRILEGYGDFASFYASALIVRDGRGNELYNYETQREVQRPLFSTVETREDALPYVHLAYETLIYIPLTFFSYSTAIGLWILLNVLILGIVSVCLPLYLHGPKVVLGVSLLLSMLASFPVLVTLIQGQDCIILLLLYSLAFICLKNDRPAVAGCVLAFGLFKFQLVLPFVGIFLLQRQWKFISGFVAASLVPVITSLYIAGSEGTMEYVRFLLRFSQSPLGQFEIEPSKMPNLRGIMYTGFSGVLSHQVLFIATVIGSIALLVWAARASRSTPLEVRFALAMLVSLSLSYYLFVYDLTLAVLPLFITVHRMSSTKNRRLRFYQSAFLVLCALLLMSPSHLVMLHYGNAPSLMALPLLGLIFLTGKQHSIHFDSTQGAALCTDAQP